MSKETIEEAAKELHPEEWDWREREIFIQGAKWQQENILQLLKDNDYQDEPVFELLTEQFKNK
jgi:hypothetical protein